MKVTFFTLVTVGLFLFLNSYGRQSKEETAKREKHIADSVAMVYQNKIVADSLEKLKKEVENPPTAKVEQLLLGKKIFGVQFIWDGYGSAMVTKEGGGLKISGSQFSKDKTEYCKLNGDITIVDERKIIIKGNIQIFTNDCCGIINKNGEFTFAKKGSRKYWRLQEFNRLCSQYTCAYYLDIFE